MRTLIADSSIHYAFTESDCARIKEALEAAIARGHRFDVEKVRSMEDDRRASYVCRKCGGLILFVSQREDRIRPLGPSVRPWKPLDIDGPVSKLGRCPADIKRRPQ